jgi:ABC-type transport system involved in multi-copper enzyme maturation permease subunit
MRWLLWREYRLNRLILIAGGAFFVLPYAIVGLGILFGWCESDHIVGAWMVSTLSVNLLAALLAGNAIAGERTDRSAEFIAYLPLSRRRIVAGKVLFTLLVFTPVWCITRVVIDNVPLSTISAHMLLDLRPYLVGVLLIYGVGWLLSSCLSSVTAASMLGIVGIFLICLGYTFISTPQGSDEMISIMMDRERYGDAVFWYTIIWIPVAVICFSLGTWNYVRRSR